MIAEQELLNNIDELLKSLNTAEEVQSEAEVKKSDEQPTEDQVQKSEDKNEGSFDEISGSGKGDGDVSLNANGGGDVIKHKNAKLPAIAKNKDGDDEDEKKEKKSMKKSFEVSEEDFEILKKAKEDMAVKEAEEKVKNDPIFKSVTGLTEMVKSLKEEIEALKKSPVREAKSLNGYQPLEKSEGESKAEEKLNKSEVLESMQDLVKSNQISPEALIEYEATGNILNKSIRSLVLNSLKKA